MNIFIGLQKTLIWRLLLFFFKISKLELHLISLGSESQNLVADTWKVLAPSDSLLYFGQMLKKTWKGLLQKNELNFTQSGSTWKEMGKIEKN